MKLNNNIILYSDNPNRAEIMDYLREFYIRHEDYNIEFDYTVNNGMIGEVSEVRIQLHTDELKEDGNLAYLIAEYTA